MKLTFVWIFVTALALSPARAQTAPSLSHEIRASYATVKKNLLAAADKVPDSDYSFKPTPEMRTFAQVVAHAATSQLHTCGAVVGQASKAAADSPTTKADVVALLKQSFSICDKAFEAFTDSSASEEVKLARGSRTRAGALAGVVTHDTEQYAALSVYMRLKGIVPPSSER